MGQVLHGGATTTHAVRTAIQRSKAPLKELAARYGLNHKTVAKWHKRAFVNHAPMGPKPPHSTVLSSKEEAIIVAFRKHTLLPLDDCLYALQATIPHLTRSSLHRCLKRHAISRLPEIAGDKAAKKPFKRYPIGYFHLDIAEVRTEKGKLYLFVAIDRTSTRAPNVRFDPLAQAGGNITGVFLRQPELAEKQVEILTQAFPEKTRLAMLWDALSADQFSAAENRAKLLHLRVLSMKLERPPYDFDAAFRSLAESTPQLLLVLSSPHFIAHRERFAQLAIKHRLPAMNTFKFYVEAGGLMSYGVDTVLPFRRAGYYVAKILQGANSAGLPVEQVTKFEMVINLKTAKAIGIELPTSISR